MKNLKNILILTIFFFLYTNSVCYSNDSIPLNPEVFNFSITGGSKYASTKISVTFQKKEGTIIYSIKHHTSDKEKDKGIVRKINRKDLIRLINVLNYTKFMNIGCIKSYTTGGILNYEISYCVKKKWSRHSVTGSAIAMPEYNYPEVVHLDYIDRYLHRLIMYREKNNSIKYWK